MRRHDDAGCSFKVARAFRGGSPEPRTRARRARFSVIHALTIHPELGDEAIAARIAAEARAGGQFVFTSLTRASVEYVLRRAGAPVEYASFLRVPRIIPDGRVMSRFFRIEQDWD